MNGRINTEKICLNNSNGRRLCGILSDAGTKTAILMFHGLGSSKDNSTYMILQDKINTSGIATFRVDLLGHGDSDGEFDDLTLTETVDDILCSKHELERRGYERIGFIGHSFGGVGGIMAASKEQFDFLILVSPPTYYDITEMIRSSIYVFRQLIMVNKETKKKKAHPNIRFFRDYASHDSYAAAEKIQAPVLIIHGDDDKIVPIAKSIELSKRINGSKIKIFKGVGHHYAKVQAMLIEEIMEFVNKQSKSVDKIIVHEFLETDISSGTSQ